MIEPQLSPQLGSKFQRLGCNADLNRTLIKCSFTKNTTLKSLTTIFFHNTATKVFQDLNRLFQTLNFWFDIYLKFDSFSTQSVRNGSLIFACKISKLQQTHFCFSIETLRWILVKIMNNFTSYHPPLKVEGDNDFAWLCLSAQLAKISPESMNGF